MASISNSLNNSIIADSSNISLNKPALNLRRAYVVDLCLRAVASVVIIADLTQYFHPK